MVFGLVGTIATVSCGAAMVAAATLNKVGNGFGVFFLFLSSHSTGFA